MRSNEMLIKRILYNPKFDNQISERENNFTSLRARAMNSFIYRFSVIIVSLDVTYLEPSTKAPERKCLD
ncbi:hypothetical protein ACTXT7_007840 [Hymenolepis weldensis]